MAQWGAQLASILNAIHDRGVVHGDIKPSNLILVEDNVWIIDFGAAFVQDNRDCDSQFASTDVFAANSVLIGGPPTFETDFISLAFTLYALHIGKEAWAALCAEKVFKDGKLLYSARPAVDSLPDWACWGPLRRSHDNSGKTAPRALHAEPQPLGGKNSDAKRNSLRGFIGPAVVVAVAAMLVRIFML